jgi:sugar lactone lactonase YvrE
MSQSIKIIFAISLFISCTITKNFENPFKTKTPTASLELVAQNTKRWTGITISQEGRLFVCFPRWSKDVFVSVGEIINGDVVPYPNKSWNTWTDNESTKEKFICVQSVFIDDQNYLWILDASSPYLRGVIEEGAKIHKFDLSNNALVRTYFIPKSIVQEKGYLNDIRIDTGLQSAYITESGLGAIIVVDLYSGNVLRRLANHYSTKAELDSIIVEGKTFKAKIHADGISLSPDKQYLYYQALCGRHLYKVPTKILRDTSIIDSRVEETGEMVAEVGVNDGIICDSFGNIYLSGLETNSINMLTSDKKFLQIIKDIQIQWPDTFTIDSFGNVYFTVAQLHLPPDAKNQYKIFKINFDKKGKS